jgi:hypothetical protein
MEAIYSSETSVDTQRTTRRYIPEDGTLQNVCCVYRAGFIVARAPGQSKCGRPYQ